MRQGAAVAGAVGLVIALLLVSTLGIGIATGDLGSKAKVLPVPGPKPFAQGTSPKTAVLEVATGTWCPPCAYSDPPISRIADEYSPDRLIVLSWHVAWGRVDPYDTPTTNARVNWYGINNNGVPTVVVDGGGQYDVTNPAKEWQVGSYTDKGQGYARYRQLVDNEYGPGTSLTISLAGDLSATTASVDATIKATDPVTLGNLQVRFVLYEDEIYFMGTNGEPYHRGVVRDMKSSPLSIVQGETKLASNSFDLTTPQYVRVNRTKLGVAVLVQTDSRISFTYPGGGTAYDAEILQAARLDYVKPGIAVYREETIADYSQPYERLLSRPALDYRMWDRVDPGDTGAVDVRGPPDPAGLAKQPMVLWYTKSQSAGVLTAPEQSLLQGQLANGNGHLLVTGENLGTAIGATSFYTDVLQASFIADADPSTVVRGAAGDPVSGTWASTPLQILGSSPDIVAPGAGGTSTFLYGDGQGAAIRSDYDADSRVVYMAYQYFEGTDPNREAVLRSIVNWFDAKSAPTLTTTFPNGGETLMPGTKYRLTWSASDVVIPKDGVDLYYASNSSNPTWIPIATHEPNDGVFTWDPPVGVDSSTCRLKVVVRDAAGNSAEDISDADFTIGAPGTPPFTMVLQPGRNLVSFSYVTQSTSLSAVLASIDPWYAWVRVYDARNPSDPWVTFYRGGPATELARLDNTMGFWIYITAGAPMTLTISGGRPVTTSIPMAAGWNLVGFPSGRTDMTVSSVRTAIGATTISAFDPTSPTWLRVMADTDLLSEGHGYWIYVPSAVSWVVPYN